MQKLRPGDVIYPVRPRGKHIITWVLKAGVLCKRVRKDGSQGAEHAALYSEIGQQQHFLPGVR